MVTTRVHRPPERNGKASARVGYSIPGIQTLLSRKKSIAPPQSISPNIRLLSYCTPSKQTPEESSPGLGWACFLLKRKEARKGWGNRPPDPSDIEKTAVIGLEDPASTGDAASSNPSVMVNQDQIRYRKWKAGTRLQRGYNNIPSTTPTKILDTVNGYDSPSHHC
ncbi:hypothetical protein D9613_010528 [Agrocybe pediades]|uniref:Uncharacterized protein n=1 Tax=Agrocybe pediades TaxID=84607 RepID=A0A8H4QF82_9AGAR|nr:hypothetical protein D9613_010528 [Agrocybe pediades]